MTQDWFAQNAPQQQAGGDWFAQNAPSQQEPQGALEQFRSESVGRRLLDVPGALAATGEAAKGILKGAGKTVANLADSALTLNRFTPSSLAASTAAKLTKTPDINAQATSTAQNAIQDVSQRYLTPTNREQKAGYYGEGAAEILAPLAKGGQIAAAARPTVEHAGAAFQSVMGAAKDVPVDVSKAGNVALQIQEYAGRGGMMPKVVRDFVKRATNPDLGPVTYQELRDFASNASRLSADEMGRLTPRVKFMVGKFASELNKANAAAAETVGKGAQYASAMKEYASAKRFEELTDTAKQILWQAVKYGIPSGALGFAVKKGLDAATQ